ncbi:AbrB family transcriptional regulator [Fusibacter sp. 3D3]|uniref:AbrB family transcriptional regulator n=1 Tax=Fusibacter sp. 3D3 TaxID=1048380 RepID=UPI0008539C0A|nr:AbrB family transcriptional regulator [Fusibacter sp. 3D3]GAU75855.1 Bll1341 protein [Fusibacter sp. 3D3]
MNSIVIGIILFTVSYIGYRLFNLIHFPASRLVGPIFAVALMQAFGLSIEIPSFFKMAFSVIFGIYLGLRFDKSAQKRLLKAIVPALVLSVSYIFITMIYGRILTSVSHMDQNTAFLSVIPGGVAEAGVLAVSFGANLAQVSSFQLVRYLSIVLVMPLLSKYIIVPLVNRHKVGEDQITKVNSLEKAVVFEKNPDENQITYSSIWFFIVGSIGSFLFYKVHFPAALLLGATVFVAALQTLAPVHFKLPNVKYYEWAQIGMGAIIGTSFTKESFIEMGTLVVPMLMMTFLIVTTSIFLGFVFSKLFKMDYMTGLMSVLPGGISTMIVLAEDLDADVVTISTLQLARLITAVAIIPILYQWLL